MKRNLLVAIALGALTVSAFGQGVVTFQAGANKLQYTTDGSLIISAPPGNPDAVGYRVSAFSASQGTALDLTSTQTPEGFLPNVLGNTNWFAATTVLQNVAPGAGTMPASSITLSSSAGAAGAVEQVELVAWTGNFASFQLAVASGTALIGWGGGTLSGGTLAFQITTGTSLSPAAISTVAGAFNKLVAAPVPEPATIVLGGLGAAALLLFRRRK